MHHGDTEDTEKGRRTSDFVAAEAIMLDYVRGPGEKQVPPFTELRREFQDEFFVCHLRVLRASVVNSSHVAAAPSRRFDSSRARSGQEALNIYTRSMHHGDTEGTEKGRRTSDFVAAEAIMLDYVRGPGEKQVPRFTELRSEFQDAVNKLKKRIRPQ